MKYILSIVMIAVLATAYAGTGKEATLSGKTESGKAQLDIKIWDLDGPVSAAKFVLPDGAEYELTQAYDALSIVDLPNHILTLCFTEKGKPADSPATSYVKVWAIPSSFVKMPGGDSNWRFKLKAKGNNFKETLTLNGSFEWNP